MDIENVKHIFVNKLTIIGTLWQSLKQVTSTFMQCTGLTYTENVIPPFSDW